MIIITTTNTKTTTSNSILVASGIYTIKLNSGSLPFPIGSNWVNNTKYYVILLVIT